PGYSKVADAAVAIDHKTQDRLTLLSSLPRGIGVALVSFEPGAQKRPIAWADLGRWHRRGYRCRRIGGLWCGDCGRRGLGRRRNGWARLGFLQLRNRLGTR